MRRLIYILLLSFLFPLTAEAAGESFVEAETPDEVSAIYGQACEKIKSGELKSSVRMRATDKASFSAVKNLSGLSDFRAQNNEHDFNVLIYAIVDNFIEDLAVRTTKQDDSEICVEITGYVQNANVQLAIEDSGSRNTSATEEGNSLKEGEKGDLEAQNFPITESPATAVEENNAPLQLISEPGAQIFSAAGPVPLAPAVKQAEEDAEAPAPAETETKRRQIYIAPTDFFDDTASPGHAEILKEVFAKNDYFYLTDNKELADYVISSKLLRAKVDPINSDTNRLQMVVMAEANFSGGNFSANNYQNRFILFSGKEDEQQVAAKLMQKLLKKAAEKVLDRVESDIRKRDGGKALPKIITPGH